MAVKDKHVSAHAWLRKHVQRGTVYIYWIMIAGIIASLGSVVTAVCFILFFFSCLLA